MSSSNGLLMRLSLIRHGQSTNNALFAAVPFPQYVVEVSVDPALTDLGWRQAQLVAGYLAQRQATPRDLPITKLYTSPMWRSLHTAQPIGAALGLAPEVWVDICEQGGMFQRTLAAENIPFHGSTRSQICHTFHDYLLPAEIRDEGWWFDGFEEMPACHDRAQRVARRLTEMARLPQTAQPHHIALVSHGTFGDVLLKALFRTVPGDHLFYFHNNTAITCLDFHTGRLAIRYLNRTEHLPPALITE